jgi:lipopolysaccharide/colanic/teichoic acid biosynthesis glycosyltransferase
MSVVGPRPERPEFLAELEAILPYWSRRALVRPGLTGWAQVRWGYASDVDGAAAKLSYDFWYIRNQGLTIDLAVCAKTVVLVLKSLLPRHRFGHEEELAREERTVAR